MMDVLYYIYAQRHSRKYRYRGLWFLLMSKDAHDQYEYHFLMKCTVS